MGRSMGGTVLALALSALLLSGCGAAQYRMPEELNQAYLSVEAYETDFLAAGAQGRLDRVHTDGSVEQLETGTDQALLDLAVQGTTAVAVGADGAAVVLEAGEAPRLSATGQESPLLSCAAFQGLWLAGTEGGVLYTADLENWSAAELALEGTVTGLAATEKRCAPGVC